MIKLRDRFLRKFTTNKSENSFADYKKFRDRVATELKTVRKKWFQNYLTESGNNMKKLWTEIKSILTKKILFFLEFIKSKAKKGS